MSPVQLRLRGLKPGRYSLAAYKVGYRSNDAYTAYLDLKRPAQLSREQVAKLRETASGKPFLEESITIDAAGNFERSFPMRQNDVIQVLLTRS